MGSFFFDESIHNCGGFILGAFAYASNDVASAVAEVLTKFR